MYIIVIHSGFYLMILLRGSCEIWLVPPLLWSAFSRKSYLISPLTDLYNKFFLSIPVISPTNFLLELYSSTYPCCETSYIFYCDEFRSFISKVFGKNIKLVLFWEFCKLALFEEVNFDCLFETLPDFYFLKSTWFSSWCCLWSRLL